MNINQELRKKLQEIADETGQIVTRVTVTWIEDRTVRETKWLVDCVSSTVGQMEGEG